MKAVVKRALVQSPFRCPVGPEYGALWTKMATRHERMIAAHMSKVILAGGRRTSVPDQRLVAVAPKLDPNGLEAKILRAVNVYGPVLPRARLLQLINERGLVLVVALRELENLYALRSVRLGNVPSYEITERGRAICARTGGPRHGG